jgi:uncharacterized repeat protein (TIGR03803 family)
MPVTVRALTSFTIALILLFEPAQLTSQEPADTFCVLHHFGDPASAAKDANLSVQPAGVIAVGDDGSLWTTASQGGNSNVGSIIRITTDGQYTRVADLNGTNGSGPQGGLVNGKNGYMYGTTSSGGRWGPGTIFRISQKGGAVEVIYDFRNGRVTGIVPQDCSTPVCAYTPEQKANMSGGFPVSAPVAIGGNLYGVTTYSNAQAYGTLYTIPLDTAPRPLTFTAATPEDGDQKMHVLCMFQPNLANDKVMSAYRCNTNGITAAFLTAGTDGNLYGTTTGVHGSVFKATTGGTVTSLHEFNGNDGNLPFSVMQASDGNLYGTTVNGGVGNWGTLYKINPNAVDFLALKYFAQQSKNLYALQFPYAGVVEGADGQLYGALAQGGPYGRAWGLLYHVAKDGSNFGILHEFNSGPNGAKPVNTPIIVEDKTYGTTLYGTTDLGGSNLFGTFYRMRVNRVTITAGTPIKTYAVPNDKDGVVIDVRTDATASQGLTVDKERDHGIAVRMKCSTDPHWVQFIYRDIVKPDNPAVPPGSEIQPNGKLLDDAALALLGVACCQTKPDDPTSHYRLTTNVNHIYWNPDAPDRPTDTNVRSPFYEGGHSAERDCDSLTLFDRPEFGVPNLVSRAVARDYAICNGAVKAQLPWVSDETLDAQSNPHWTYQVSVGPASKIPDYFLCQLQNKHYQLPPGQSIPPNVICTSLPDATAWLP